MQIQGHGTGTADGRSAFALGIDPASIIQTIACGTEARGLPKGTIVGDLHGGLTFSDAVAAALEARSVQGWHEWRASSGETWTIIVLDR
jgi:hypothetical protein